MKIIVTIFMLCCITVSASADYDVVFAHTEWKPFIYTDTKGQSQGVFHDIIVELFEHKLNMAVTFSSRPWKRAQFDVENGDADAMVTAPTEKREGYAIKTGLPIYQLFIRVYSYEGHIQLGKINQIKSAHDIKSLGLIPVTNLGNGWHKQHIDAFGVKTYYVPKDESIAFVLANKRADIMLESAESMNRVLKENGLERKIVLTDAKFGPINLHLMVSKKSKLSKKISQINGALIELKNNGFIDSVTQKYMELN